MLAEKHFRVSLFGSAQTKKGDALYGHVYKLAEEIGRLGFEDIAREFPGDVKPYIEMIDMAVVNLRDGERARMIFYKGLAELEKEEDKDALKQMFEATMTRLEPEPEWLEEEGRRTLTAPDLSDQAPVKEPDGRTARRFHAGPKGRYEGPSEKT